MKKRVLRNPYAGIVQVPNDGKTAGVDINGDFAEVSLTEKQNEAVQRNLDGGLLLEGKTADVPEEAS